MSHINFIEKNGHHLLCDFKEGETVLTVARRSKVDLEGTCDGSMACSTCHVIVDQAWLSKLPSQSAEEKALLDLAQNPTPQSRLGCQIILKEDLNGLVVKLP